MDKLFVNFQHLTKNLKLRQVRILLESFITVYTKSLEDQ